MDKIDRRALINALCREAGGNDFLDVDTEALLRLNMVQVLNAIANMPSVESPQSQSVEAPIVERTHGRHHYVECGNCGTDIGEILMCNKINYCPFCGRKLTKWKE